jgi:heme exporter protein D
MSAMQHLLAVGGDAATFFRMGGYAAYVWPAYAVFFAVLVADNVAPRLRRRRILRELRDRLARQAARERRAPSPSVTPSP